MLISISIKLYKAYRPIMVLVVSEQTSYASYMLIKTVIVYKVIK